MSKQFQYEIRIFPVTAFQDLVYFCTDSGECREAPVPGDAAAKLEELLNQRGRDGWELIQIQFSQRGIFTLWKREIARRD
jgi:hypothetical protein